MLQVYLRKMHSVRHLFMYLKLIFAEGNPRYLVINTGNANAGTGPTGLKKCLRILVQS